MDTTRPDKTLRPVSVSRRRAMFGIGGVAAGVFAAKTAAPLAQAVPADHIAHALATPATADAESQVREFVLVAEEIEWELMPGVPTRAWGYNGQTPGPEIRVREGDLLRITLRNNLSAPTTIHWHGVHLSPAMDGPAGLNQAAVLPGQEFVYEFVATPAGTRWYHSHADPQLQVPMGLYGPLIIEPRQSTRPYGWDREYTLVLGEWDSELTPEVAAGRAARGPRDQQLRGGELGTDMFLVNGRAHGAIPPLVVREGERVLLRMINAGHLAHPIHMHGHSFKIVATDGNPVPVGMEWTKDTVLIGPSERYDLEFDANNPGVWMFHCHIEHHMANGMMTVIQYEGHSPSGPAADFFEETLATAAVPNHADHEGTVTPQPDATTEAATGSGDTVEVRLIDDRFDPVWIEIPAGTTVVWVNNGADWHNVASSKAGFASDKILPGERYQFTFTIPGEYKIVCRHHGLAGMTGTIVVI